jgi:hypothetical protein
MTMRRRATLLLIVGAFAVAGCDADSEPNDGGGNGGDASNCDPSYEGACIPPYEQTGDLDCADVSGPFSVVGSDPHGFDGDGDGVGCET